MLAAVVVRFVLSKSIGGVVVAVLPDPTSNSNVPCPGVAGLVVVTGV